jgi:hypothetical protein
MLGATAAVERGFREEYGRLRRLVEKFQQLREELGISSIMLGEIDELAPVLERLTGD